jgi:hypothetical protein
MPATELCVTVIWSVPLKETKVIEMFIAALRLVAVSEQCDEVVTPAILIFVEDAAVVVKDARMGILAPVVLPIPSLVGLLLSVFRYSDAMGPPVSITRLSSASWRIRGVTPGAVVFSNIPLPVPSTT